MEPKVIDVKFDFQFLGVNNFLREILKFTNQLEIIATKLEQLKNDMNFSVFISRGKNDESGFKKHVKSDFFETFLRSENLKIFNPLKDKRIPIDFINKMVDAAVILNQLRAQQSGDLGGTAIPWKGDMISLEEAREKINKEYKDLEKLIERINKGLKLTNSAINYLSKNLLYFTLVMSYLKEQTQGLYTGGNNLTSNAKVLAFNSIYGGSAKDAAAFNEYLKTNPYARGLGANNGLIPNYIGKYGNIDYSHLFLQGVKIMKGLSKNEAIRFAGDGPLRSYLWIRDLDSANETNAKYLMKLSPLNNNTLSSFTNLSATLKTTWNLLLSIILEIASMLAPIITRIIEVINIALSVINFVVGNIGRTIKAIFDLFLNRGNFSDDIKALKNLWNDNSEVDRYVLDNHTEAMNKHTRMLTNQIQVYGGGQNSEHAIPKGWENYNLANSLSGIMQGQMV